MTAVYVKSSAEKSATNSLYILSLKVKNGTIIDSYNLS